MKLPGAERAIIDPRKLRDYALSRTHPVGRFKAVFFASLGYSLDNWEALEAVLRSAAIEGEAESGSGRAMGGSIESAVS